jgi:ribosome maturation factor RimP
MNEQHQSVQQQSTTNSKANLSGSVSQSDRLIALINPLIAPLGYEIVTVELLTHKQKTLRIFIDFAETPKADAKGVVPSIGIEDCVKVAQTLDEPLDLIPEVEAIFQSTYELEVSSPGVDRPLRQAKDFERFKERQIRVHTYRPLNAEELGNAEYAAKNPKQKNFLGYLKGLDGERIVLVSGDASGDAKSKNKKSKAKQKAKPRSPTETQVFIPLSLVSKANLEPVFDFSSSSEAGSDGVIEI